MKFYNNKYVRKILSGATAFVLMTSNYGVAHAVKTITLTDTKGKEVSYELPDNVNVAGIQINEDGTMTVKFDNNMTITLNDNQNTTITSNNFDATVTEFSYNDYIKMCNEQVTEIKRCEKEIKRIQEEYYKVKNFEINYDKALEFAKAYVYINNFQFFTEEAKTQIIANDISTDMSELIGNNYGGFTNFVNAYNQTIVREQEITGSYDKSKLISCEYSFGNKTDRSEYIYARDTWYNSVKNGRAWNDDFDTLYCYISMFSGAGLSTNYLGNASIGAQAGINRTVGQDFKESIKVVFDKYMSDASNKEKFKTYFSDVVTYKPREDAKQNLTIYMNSTNQLNEQVAIARENGDFSVDAVNLCYDNLETLIYYYIHILDNVDDFKQVMSALNNEFSTKTK